MNLTDLMQDSMANVLPRPGLGEDALQTARRRLRRRHAALFGMTGITLVGLLVGGQNLATGVKDFAVGGDGPRPSSSPVSHTQGGPLADGRRHGDLANDSAYLSAVNAVWRTYETDYPGGLYSHPVGDPAILWAGSTPAGPAALLEQTVDLTKRIGGTSPGRYAALGFIGTSPTGPRVTIAHFSEDRYSSTAWFVDPDHRVLAITDNAVARGISYHFTYDKDGTARRVFTPLSFTDGMAVVELPKDASAYNTAVADLPWHSYSDNITPANFDLPREAPQGGVPWSEPGDYLRIPLSDAEAPLSDDAINEKNDALIAATENSYLTSGEGSGSWIVYGTTGTGSKVRVFQRQLNAEPARLCLLLDGHLSDQGIADASAPLPVKVHLPNGQGWVVAHYGASLRARSGTDSWQVLHADAALISDTSTEVEVTLPGRSPVLVPLHN